jgi:aspartate-semialdehyde dehydrogenase
MTMNKIPVAVLGATGLVGQRLIRRLANHPWFELAALTGSERSVGRPYGEAVNWRLPGDPPAVAAAMTVQPSAPGLDAKLLFSALPTKVAVEVEPTLAAAGYILSSNASAFRAVSDVPLIQADVNADHLPLVRKQTERGWKGFIITNANCVAIPTTLSLKPLHDAFGVEQVFVVSMQAVSGAGYPGVASLDIVDNVIPYIGGEESKIEYEPRKMLGTLVDDETIAEAPFRVSAQANRVASRDGHMVCVSVKFQSKVSPEEAMAAMREYRGRPQVLSLPSAAPQPILVRMEADRPQPIRDRDSSDGMAVTVGRVRECPLFDLKYVALGHNTEGGAAGAALLNGELLAAEGYLD